MKNLQGLCLPLRKWLTVFEKTQAIALSLSTATVNCYSTCMDHGDDERPNLSNIIYIPDCC